MSEIDYFENFTEQGAQRLTVESLREKIFIKVKFLILRLNMFRPLNKDAFF